MAKTLEAKLAQLAQDFSSRYSQEATLNWVRRLWESDRWSDYTAFRRTAEYAAEELRRIGAQEVEIVPCPADGRTRMQAWTMPLAWEGGAAVLRLLEPRQEVLCDRQREPLSAAMWSEPTPPGGLRGPLVVVDSPGAPSPAERQKLRGAFLLTGKSGRGQMKVFAHQVGAAAIVSHFVPHHERHIDAVGWSNGWSDDDGGWAMNASDCRMTGFQISPVVGARLRRLVADGPVVCEAVVGGRVGPGTLPVVTAVLPGESAEEILLIGHLYEIGVVDNASGCGAMLEALRLMASLPRPKRRVRILLTGECYGTYAFFTLRANLLGRTLAGLNVDCVGEVETAGRPHFWHRTPEAAPAAVNALLRAVFRVTESCPGGLSAAEESHSLSDNALSDPAAGVPTPCFMRSPWTWHTSLDDWSQLDPAAMRRAAVVTAAYARWLAEAGVEDAQALAETVAADAHAQFPEGGDLAPERRAFFLDRARACALWTKKLGATRADELAAGLPALDLASLVRPEDGGDEQRHTIPARSFWGAPTFDNIPPADRDGFTDPRWAMLYVTASYWADGRRSLAEIAALVSTEFDKPMKDLPAFFRVLERGNLVRLHRP
jgi:hypothetical protein